MKNFILVTLASVIFPCFPQVSVAQKKLKFIDNIEITQPAGKPMVMYAHLSDAKREVRILSNKKATSSLKTDECNQLQLKYALVLNSELEAISDFSLFSFIDSWYGVRYRYGGTSKKGIDCSAFTGRLYFDVFGNLLPRTAREQFAATERISRKDLIEGDLVFFNTTGGVSHVGVYLTNGYFVHAARSGGIMISHLDEPYFTKRYLGAGRLHEGHSGGQVKVL